MELLLSLRRKREGGVEAISTMIKTSSPTIHSTINITRQLLHRHVLHVSFQKPVQ